MSKPALKNKSLLGGEVSARRILAQVRIVDSCEHLRDLQRQMRRHAQVFTQLQKLPLTPGVTFRELLAKLKKTQLSLSEQIADIRENLEIACNLLKPPG